MPRYVPERPDVHAMAARRLRALGVAAALLTTLLGAQAIVAAPGDPPTSYTNEAAFHADAGATTSVIDFEQFHPDGASSCGLPGTPIPNPTVIDGVTFSSPACIFVFRQQGSFFDPVTDQTIEIDSMALLPRTGGANGFEPTTLSLAGTCGIGFHPRHLGGSASSKMDATAVANGGGSAFGVSFAGGNPPRDYFLGFWSPDGLTSITFQGSGELQDGNPPIESIELVACPGPSDTDGDGVPDALDVMVGAPPASVGFSDAVLPDLPSLGSGTSAIVTPNGLGLSVEDLDSGVASSAVRVAAFGSGGPMSIVPCGLAMTLVLDAGDTVTLDCGSVGVVVEDGDGVIAIAGQATISIPDGVSVTLDTSGGSTVIRDVQGGSVQMTVDGVTTSLAPGGPPASFLTAHDFIGFLHPVDPIPTPNVAKSGSAIPLRWRVIDAAGNPVTTITNAAVATKLSAACTGGVAGDQIEQYVASNQSGLQNLGDGYYQLNWKTNKAWAGSCRQLVLSVDGATILDANPVFQFK